MFQILKQTEPGVRSLYGVCVWGGGWRKKKELVKGPGVFLILQFAGHPSASPRGESRQAGLEFASVTSFQLKAD